MMSHSPNKVIIDLSAIVHNLNQVKRLVNPETKIMGIVKSDAYGHGIWQVSRILEKVGVYCLGVAHIQEALELRQNGIRLPIVILCGIRTREDARQIVDKSLTPVLFDLEMARVLDEESIMKGKRTRVHLKVDTGMGRLGISIKDVGYFLENISKFKGLYLEAITSHLSSADESDTHFTEVQIKHFKKAVEIGHAMGFDLPLNNLANSAGIMAYRDSHFNLVRPGIMLYGGLPSPEFKSPLPLKPAMTFVGQILQIRDLPDQTPVSYGRTYLTRAPQRIAVLSAGYGDGLPRSLSNRGKVLIGGRKVCTIGRVCMNMMMSDLTGMNDVLPGNEVVFLGEQGEENITGEQMARWGETISYEIFCSIGQRNIREYIS